MPKALADGHIKFTLLTDEPADPAKPTAAELNAGIEASFNVLASDFTWSAVDSDKVGERALGEDENVNAFGASNYQAGFTVFRKFDATTGVVDETEDALFQAVKAKGSRVWGYVRQNGKPAAAVWADEDELWLGQELLTDTPQTVTGGGYIKARVPCESQNGWPFGALTPAV